MVNPSMTKRSYHLSNLPSPLQIKPVKLSKLADFRFLLPPNERLQVNQLKEGGGYTLGNKRTGGMTLDRLIERSHGSFCHTLSHSVTLCHALSHFVTLCHTLSHSVTLCHCFYAFFSSFFKINPLMPKRHFFTPI